MNFNKYYLSFSIGSASAGITGIDNLFIAILVFAQFPLASIIAGNALKWTWSIVLMSVSNEMLFQACITSSFKVSIVLGILLFTCDFKIDQICSIGFISGLLAGCFKICPGMLFWRNSFTILAVCEGALSCWKFHAFPCFCIPNGIKFSFMIFRYSSAFIFVPFGIKWIAFPFFDITPQIINEIFGFFGWKMKRGSIVDTQVFLVFLNNSILYLSVKTTLSQEFFNWSSA